MGAVGFLIGLMILALLAAPEIVDFGPSRDSPHVPAGAPIRISFDRPMDRTSVEARLTLAPHIPGAIDWEGNTFLYRPTEPWPSGQAVAVRLDAGARSNRFLPVLRSLEWSFQASQPRLSYLWPSKGSADLYLLDLQTGESDRLTEAEAGVIDYTVAADGTTIVYSALDVEGVSELRQIDLSIDSDELLFRCDPTARCLTPTLSPDGDLLAYERFEWETTASGRQIPGPREVWVLPLAQGAEPARAQPQGQITTAPGWSPQGILTFYNDTLRAVAFLEPFGSQPLSVVPNGLGMLGSWSPDGEFLVLPEIVFPVEEQHDDTHTHPDFFSHLYRVDAETLKVDDLSLGTVEDASPVFSPNGDWIAFGRKFLDDRWTPGRQLWIMNADGSEARPITDEPDFSHTSLAWNPSSTHIAYMRLSQTDPNQAPEIWVTDLEGDDGRLWVEGGYLPQWIP